MEKRGLHFLLDTRSANVHNGGMTESSNELSELRQQAHFYRAQHARACKRESVLKETVAELQRVVRSQKRRLGELTQLVEKLEARIAWLSRQLFGNKSEGSDNSEPETSGDVGAQSADADSTAGTGKRKRGQQPGKRSSGRKTHPELPAEEIVHDLGELECCCPQCGLPFEGFPGTEDSEEIDWELRLVRRVHKRKRYRRACHCAGVPGIVTAPVPPKLIPKGKFSTEFWARLLEQKYLFQIPLHRILKMLELEGGHFAQGTITDSLKRIGALIEPLYARILEHSRNARHWHMDETGWKVFEEVEGKKGLKWWLWIVVTRDTCVYLLDPSRSGDVPRTFLGERPEGIISADRYVAYKGLLSALLFIAYCWAHVRRDFCRLRDGYGALRGWATGWVKRIDALFHCNAQRIQTRSNAAAFDEQDRALREQMEDMARVRDEELADPSLHPAARKVLQSLERHWDGLEIFVENPDIPMDNNTAERGLRNPVVGRKNYSGSGSVWSGMFSAMMFTVFQTLLLNNVNPHRFLMAYFNECARNKGSPPEVLDDFLPWRFGRDDEKAA